MKEKEPSRFRICIEENESHPAEGFDHPEEGPPRPVRHVMPYLPIILFSVLGAALGFGYFDMTRRLDRVQRSSTLEIDSISKNIEKQLSSQTESQQEIKKSGVKKDASIEKQIAELREIIQGFNTKIAALETSRPDKKEMETAVGKSDQAISAIHKELAALSGAIGAMDKKLSAESAKLSGNMGKINVDHQRIQNRLDAVSAEKLDKQILEIKLKAEQRAYRQALTEATRSLEGRIQSMDGKIETLEKAAGGLGQKSPPRPAPVSDPGQVKPGKITEQDIKD
ncbi:MAG: hypothetical protein AB1659_06380 [Thermodesulfobacteriota bacterium]